MKKAPRQFAVELAIFLNLKYPKSYSTGIRGVARRTIEVLKGPTISISTFLLIMISFYLTFDLSQYLCIHKIWLN